MDKNEILSVIEGMLFLSGDEGLTIKQISSVLKLSKKEATQYVDELIQICLLYTSPSPRDRQKSRMPSSA